MPVSIIVPVHNAGNFLGVTLSSIANALDVKDQLILVFDSCTDDSFAAYTKWRNQSGSAVSFDILTIESRYGNVAEARNAGLNKVDRPWLTFADHDDLVWARGYKDLLSVAEHSKADVVRAGYVKQSLHNSEVVYPNFSPEVYAFYGIFVWNSLFSSGLVFDNDVKFNRGYGEDYEFNLCISRHCRAQAFLRKPVYTWRIHGANQHLSRRPSDFVERVFGIIERNREYLDSCPNACAAFLQWVREYKLHMKNEFPIDDIEAQFTRANLADFNFNHSLIDII